jgi:hypothetical protein
MSIRVVNDAGEVFWFTSGNWRLLLAFASRHDWLSNPTLNPDNWNEPMTWNSNYEIVGGASLGKAEAQALANAIDRGLRDDPRGASVASDLQTRAKDVQRILPDYDPALHAAGLLKEWSRFGDFARGNTLRIDLTD